MNQLFEIYETLRHFGFCFNQSDFSVHWLGRSRCYMSYLKRTGADPSLTSMKLLVARLEAEVELAKHSGEEAFYRPMRSALVAARTIHDGVYELKYVPPFYRITAINSS
ncbi:hypothetical protein KYN89_15215 [Alteriqipengyuania sp. NZ-12B]|uniref:Uncharacterized protein n=1 Tax=Alteriqipengyuania abyssalis TaxID=2860200 RepID=A0ABS7PI55_9SPHN|nr:DUF6626 family protein [Alteriqipengyuania abyssalis]MBY8338397.1 hypothetical protein [Alteriqipengyuania abyssalis]